MVLSFEMAAFLSGRVSRAGTRPAIPLASCTSAYWSSDKRLELVDQVDGVDDHLVMADSKEHSPGDFAFDCS